MNPFEERARRVEDGLQSFSELYPRPYVKREVDPYTKTRIILMNGTEFEANWFSHQLARHTDNVDLRREIALTREVEKQQQLKISLLKPPSENILEHTISYEQLAVDLPAFLAQREQNANVRAALDFALLEDFDHLYRYADLLDGEQGIRAEMLVGRYTEIMPGRPTIAHHRHPFDNVRLPIDAKSAATATVLDTMIITAAEQQTMNYYMNVTNFACTDTARRLYEEIALVEEEHVTHYEALMDPNATWLEMLLWHEYCECYLYYSALSTETDPCIRALWEENFEMELSHLHKAKELLEKYEGKEWQSVIRDPEFPEPVVLKENISYVRGVLAATVQNTTLRESYTSVDTLPPDADFFRFQGILIPSVECVPSHNVIEEYLRRHRQDYRFAVAEHPIVPLRDRKSDNTAVGRCPGATQL